jgi:hypothetical protein
MESLLSVQGTNFAFLIFYTSLLQKTYRVFLTTEKAFSTRSSYLLPNLTIPVRHHVIVKHQSHTICPRTHTHTSIGELISSIAELDVHLASRMGDRAGVARERKSAANKPAKAQGKKKVV